MLVNARAAQPEHHQPLTLAPVGELAAPGRLPSQLVSAQPQDCCSSQLLLTFLLAYFPAGSESAVRKHMKTRVDSFGVGPRYRSAKLERHQEAWKYSCGTSLPVVVVVVVGVGVGFFTPSHAH